MLVSIPNPSRVICSSGITNEKKSVEGSRRTCSVSLKNTAPNPRKRLRIDFLWLTLMLVGQLDKHIFQAGRKRANLRYLDSIFHELFAQAVQIEMLFNQSVDRLSKNGCTANPWNLSR